MKFRHLILICSTAAALCACSKEDDWSGGYYPPTSQPDESEAVQGDKYEEISDNPFVSAEVMPTSTFSVDCDGASYANMRRFVRSGILPDANSVRIEEFLNYFTFDYPEPEGDAAISVNSEVAVCPWDETHRLVRLGIKGKSMTTRPNSNFVLLVDVSGSMNSNDKIELLKTSFCTLLDYLDPKDRVSVITYASGVKKLIESTPVSESAKIKRAIQSLSASGCTAGADALTMAYEEAEQNFIEGGNNRIIMGTDGDFNVGVTSTDALIEIVSNFAKKGIYITICGFGRGNLNDGMIERVTNAGNGTYEYIDSEEEVTKVFVNESSKFFAVANDVKIQVEFDPLKVAQYRLIGYENRVMANEDFDRDETDASEIGAGQTITALYEIIPAKDYAPEASMADFRVRYKKELGQESILVEDTVKCSGGEVASANMSLAAGTAAYGMVLRSSPYKGNGTFSLAAELVGASLDFDPFGYRAQFVELIDAASKITRY